MDLTALKHIHMTVAIGYFVIYNVKCLLFLFSGQEKYLWYKGKTIIVEMILSIMFLASGLWMLLKIGMGNMPVSFHIKLTLVLLTIPLGIIGFKKNSKVLVFLSMACLIAVLYIALLVMK